MYRYKLDIIGLCEIRWKQSGEITTNKSHKVYYSGGEDKHEQGVGFLVYKRYCDNCHRMLPYFEQTNDTKATSKSFQRYSLRKHAHAIYCDISLL